MRNVKVTLINQSFQQPLSSIFVMVHTKETKPLYVQGAPASTPLAILAEDGNPQPLVDFYNDELYEHGVLIADSVGGPVLPSGNISFIVQMNDKYNRLTAATMAINTNDCFVALNGVELTDEDATYQQPGLDAGSEENNELCTSIPGPACAPESGNVRSGNGEGFVHVHRGFHGINEGETLAELDNGANGRPLTAVGYDWRNPMARFDITTKLV